MKFLKEGRLGVYQILRIILQFLQKMIDCLLKNSQMESYCKELKMKKLKCFSKRLKNLKNKNKGFSKRTDVAMMK